MFMMGLIEILAIIFVLCIIAAVGYAVLKIVRGCFGQGCLIAFAAIVVIAIIYYLVA